MKIYQVNNESGGVDALIRIEPYELALTEHPFDDEEQLQAAIAWAVSRLEDELHLRLMYPAIESVDEQEDGSVMFSVHAIIKPEVRLGRYKGLNVSVYSEEDVIPEAVSKATRNAFVDLPERMVERELDSLKMQFKAQLLQERELNQIADLHAVLQPILAEEIPDGEIWLRAKKALENCAEEPEMTELIASLTEQTKPAQADDLPSRLERLIEDRLKDREEMPAEYLADEVFQAYLAATDSTEEQWRNENREDASMLAKQSLVLDAVAEAEELTVSAEEIGSELTTLSNLYDMEIEEILKIITEDAIRYHLRIDKAMHLIGESAVRL